MHAIHTLRHVCFRCNSLEYTFIVMDCFNLPNATIIIMIRYQILVDIPSDALPFFANSI